MRALRLTILEKSYLKPLSNLFEIKIEKFKLIVNKLLIEERNNWINEIFSLFSKIVFLKVLLQTYNFIMMNLRKKYF